MISISKNLLSLVLILSVTACSSWFKRKEEPVKIAPILEAAAPAKELSAPSVAQPVEPVHTETVDVTANKTSFIDQKYSDKTEVEKTEAYAESKTEGVAPEKSLGWLKNGNARFTKNNLRKDGQSKKDIKRLSKGQKPHAVVLTSSDSRMPPEIIFDQKLGEIFVVRTLTLALDPSATTSIEHAIEHLGTKLVVIMGHTSGELLPESWASTNAIAKDLLEKSALIKNKTTNGEVQIVSSLYNLDIGKVEFEK